MKLFCLPYAGGSENVFHSWLLHLNPNIQLQPVPLKGRGTRFSEEYYSNVDEAVNDIFENIKDQLNNDFAIFGHSMGGLFAYELYYKIRRSEIKPPKHLFFSGYKAPYLPKKKKPIYNLPDNEFKRKIIDLGGTPMEVINNQELFDLFLPILKNDFKIVDQYIHHQKESKINSDITVFYGEDDIIDKQDVLAWKNQANKNFKLYKFKGGHFFINHEIDKVVSIINKTLTTDL